jgi:hypothetical protein
MPKQIKLRRGTTAQHATFTGAQGEITVDTTKKTVVVHDGATAGGIPLALEASQMIKTGGLVWVDAVNGNDVTAQRGRLQLPFRTLTAAKNSAVSGDTIMVLPGAYSEKNLAKNGVNWHYMPGAMIIYVGSVGCGIYDTEEAGMPCTFSITGNGVFKVTNEPSPMPFLLSAYSADNISVQCDRIDVLGNALMAQGTIQIRCAEMKSAADVCIATYGVCNVMIDCPKISSSGDTAVQIVDGTLEIQGRFISSTGAHGIAFSHGVANITAQEIISTAGHGVTYSICGPAAGVKCCISNARIVSMVPAKTAVYTMATGLQLSRCTLVSTPPATLSIVSNGAYNVMLYGECVANLPKDAALNLIGSAMTVNPNLT